MLRAIWKTFRKSESGRDLAEYCLVTALTSLVALGIFLYASGGIQSIWGNAGTALTAGDSASPAPGSGGTTPAVASTPADH
jgi:Flp pilus assembly pilin Flp